MPGPKGLFYAGGRLHQAPVRPYRSLAEYRAKVIKTEGAKEFFGKPENANKWPCLGCDGKGTIYDPQDPGDPIEGNKYRNRIACPLCNGTRCIPKKLFAETYQLTINSYLDQKKRFQTLKQAHRTGLRKLTKLEREAIAEFGT